jgi:hypothetical protein
VFRVEMLAYNTTIDAKILFASFSERIVKHHTTGAIRPLLVVNIGHCRQREIVEKNKCDITMRIEAKGIWMFLKETRGR